MVFINILERNDCIHWNDNGEEEESRALLNKAAIRYVMNERNIFVLYANVHLLSDFLKWRPR
jgi:hypothetical protein